MEISCLVLKNICSYLVKILHFQAEGQIQYMCAQLAMKTQVAMSRPNHPPVDVKA